MNDVPRLRVLVVEDDPDTRDNLCDILSLDGHTFEAAGSAAEARARDHWSTYDVILLDWRLPDASAGQLLPQIRQKAPDVAVIVSTGMGGIDEAIMALRHGAADYITKPIDVDLLRASLRRVAEQLKLREDKRHSEAAFRTLVESVGGIILILELDGTIAYLNPFGERLTGYDTDELRRQKYVDVLIPPEFRELATGHLSNVIGGRAEHDCELPVRDRTATQHWVLWNFQRLADFGGRSTILAIGQDVTARRLAEQKLLQAERLAAIGQAMTGLAHESRNALQRGQADLELLTLLVEDRPDALRLVHRLQLIQQELHRLYEEVRAYAAPIRLSPESADLASLAREAWDLLAQARGTRNARLDIAADSPGTCRVDRYQFLQVFRNLFENSLSAAADPLRIHVALSLQQVDGTPWIATRVCDNGPGIPVDVADTVFEPFVTTKTRGTGLGLAIVRRIVEAHHGRIWIGRPSSGAEIVLELPVATPA